jgi:hypothetical protein
MKSISEHGETLIELSKFVKQLDEPVRAEAFKFLLAQEVGQVLDKTDPASPAIQRERRSRAIAPQELIRKSNASSFTEKAIVLAYWLEEYQQQPTFSSADLKNAFEQAREKLPKNTSDLVANLEESARVMKTEKVGAVQHYRLTSTAVTDIENELNSKKDGK